MNAVIPAAMARRLMASMLAKSGEGAGAPPQRIVAAVCLRDSGFRRAVPKLAANGIPKGEVAGETRIVQSGLSRRSRSRCTTRKRPKLGTIHALID
jgi:hypothetical protein